MKLLFKGFTILTETFDSIEYLRDYDAIAFTYNPSWDAALSQPVVLNLCFNNADDVRRVYMKILENIKGRSSKDEFNFTDYVCTWPVALAKRVETIEKLYLNSI